MPRVRLTREYDLFVAVCQNYWNLPYLNAIDGWKDQCKTSVCWIDEMWVGLIPQYKHWLHVLGQFDHVFVGQRGTAAVLSDAIGKTCHWLPLAVDALRFSPYPNPPARTIDVYSIGRRWEGIHQTLLEAAEGSELFYVYDTFPGADMEAYDHQQHRALLANMAKRARYYMVAPAKMDCMDETRGQIEFGSRFYEGAAGGAVMIGEKPDCDAFKELFPWPNAVIPIQGDGSDVLDVLARLDSRPEQTAAIGRRNAAEVLLRHDWIYRWKQIFRAAGVEPSPAMTAREGRLRQLANPGIAAAS